ncbi:MAG TPA: sterol desaturase family protein [Vicinamibacteria bacterium]|nr:sterol desaturase family protein [Vicinamibacteria bacterium]
MYTLLKSEVGPFPEPEFPQGIDLPAEDRKARRRLYPVTGIYPLYFILLLVLAIRSHHTLVALGFVALGLVTWVPLEYLVHRHILHGVFPKNKDPLSLALHHLFDASHADHHARPWDGMHINGHVDTLFAAVLFFPLSFLAPHYTAPVWVATVFMCFLTEEWTHHAIHFWNLKSPYFQYIRRRHLFHHSRHGVGLAYGITSGIWDVVANTRVPEDQREALSPWTRPEPGDKAAPPPFGAA